jgi:hypothetical protein
MMKKNANPTFTHKVTVRRPVDGGFSDESFTARFAAKSVTELDGFNLFTSPGTTEYLQAILVGWGADYVDADGSEIPFSNAERDELINEPVVRKAFIETNATALGGAKRGN